MSWSLCEEHIWRWMYCIFSPIRCSLNWEVFSDKIQSKYQSLVTSANFLPNPSFSSNFDFIVMESNLFISSSQNLPIIDHYSDKTPIIWWEYCVRSYFSHEFPLFFFFSLVLIQKWLIWITNFSWNWQHWKLVNGTNWRVRTDDRDLRNDLFSRRDIIPLVDHILSNKYDGNSPEGQKHNYFCDFYFMYC